MAHIGSKREVFSGLAVPPGIYKASEVCAMLRISRVTLYRMLESGAIRGWRIDRHWRFLGSDIEACTQRQARTTPRRRKV